MNIILERITVLKRKPLLSAIIITLISVVLVIFCCDIKYAISDDYITDAILSGAFSDSLNPYVPFSNVILGYILVFFYSITSNISCYFYYLFICGVIAITTINYICLKNSNYLFGLFLAIVNSFIFSNDLLIIPSFTHNAAAIILAGGLLLTDTLWSSKEVKNKTFPIILSIIFILMGSMLRFSCIYIAVPYIGIMFIIKMIKNFSTEKKYLPVLKKLAIYSLILCLCFIVNFIGNYINSKSEYAYFFEIDKYRSYAVDTMNYNFECYKDEFSELDYDLIDKNMITYWELSDTNVFPLESIIRIGDIYNNYHNQHRNVIELVLYRLKYSNALLYPITFLSILCAAYSLIINKKNLVGVALNTLVLLSLYALFFYMGRIPYRIEFGILYGFFTCLTINDYESALKGNLVNKLMKGLLIASIVLVSIYQIPNYIPSKHHTNNSYDDYLKLTEVNFNYADEFNTARYNYDIYSCPVYDNLINHIENDQNHYYLFSFASTIQKVYYHYKPYERIPVGYFLNNYTYTTGCTLYYPDQLECLKSHGINPDELLYSCIDSDVYIVVQDDVTIPLYVTYLRRHYDPNINAELIETIDTMEIWHLYIETEK